MITASPHRYRRSGEAAGVPAAVINHALRQAAAPERRRMPAILTLNHLSHQTGASYDYLRSIVSRHHDPYSTFTVQKRRGGHRLLAAPERQLLEVQQWLVSEVLSKCDVHSASQAYAKGCSVYRSASHHAEAKWLIKIDIHDFFESISEKRAYYVFRGCGYQPLVSFELARLCTRVSAGRSAQAPQWQIRRVRPGSISSYNRDVLGHLPQGAPTSPMLSNLVSYPLDELLASIAEKQGFVFTRYSDDLTFSTLQNIARKDAWTLVEATARALWSFGHRIHRKKITIAPPGARKLVLGLLVESDRPRLSREVRRRLENHVRGVEKFGLTQHVASRHFSSHWGFIRHVRGLIAHAASVDPDYGAALKARFVRALAQSGWSGERVPDLFSDPPGPAQPV